MLKAELLALWLGIAAVGFVVAFPPYGYEQYETSTVIVGLKDGDSVEYVPWTYVGHSFLFARAPEAEIDRVEKGNGENGFLMYAVRARVKISWSVLALEVLLVLLITAGAIASIQRVSRERASSVAQP